MGWNDTTKMMSLPISAGDISQAVSYRSTDIGTLIRKGTINKWAKYKPVAYPGIDFSADLDNGSWKTGSGGATWWKTPGVDGVSCGLTFTVANALSQNSISTSGFFHDLINGLLPWNYIRPNGGINAQPFRVFDFIEYYGLAKCPAGNIATADIWLDYGQTGWEGQITFDTESTNNYSLTLADFALTGTSVTDCYLGILLYRSNPADAYYGTSTAKITAGSSISLPLTNAQALEGAWTCAPFLSSINYGSITERHQEQFGKYASLFGLDSFTITIHAPGTKQEIIASCDWNSTHTGINYIITIVNNEDQERTITGLGLEIRMYDPGEQPTDGDNVTGSPFSFSGSFVVPAHTDVVAVTGFLPNISKEEGKLYAAHAYATGHMNSRWEEVGDVPDGENRN